MLISHFQIVNIFNLFITYGDTFLPNPNSYDELYYEVIRMHQVFDNLYSMGKCLITSILRVSVDNLDFMGKCLITSILWVNV